MTRTEIVTLAAALLALAGSIVSLFVSTTLALKKERRQLLWTRELDRFLELEELAGSLVEEAGSYRPIPDDRSGLQEKLSRLEHAAGRFGRYAEVRQAIRDLHNTIGRMLTAKRNHDDDRAVRAELDPALRAFLAACDSVCEREKL